MTGSIDRSAEGNGLGNDIRKRLHIGKMTVSLAVTAVMVFSAVFLVMSVPDGSDADPSYEVLLNGTTPVDTLVNAVGSANDNDVIEIVVPEILLDDTLVITKKITLTTNCEAVIKPSDVYTGMDSVRRYMIYVNGDTESGSLTIGESVSDDPYKVLTFNGDHRFGVIYSSMQGKDYDTLTINTGHITNGYANFYQDGTKKKCINNGVGIFSTHGARLIMNGGAVIDNHLNPDNPDTKTDIRFSKDIWIGSGSKAFVYGGHIGQILVNALQNNAKDYLHRGDLTLNGEKAIIDDVYVVYNYFKDAPEITGSANFTYEQGTVGNLMLSTAKHNGGDLKTFDYSKVKMPLEKKTYTAGTHIVQINEHGYGYENIEAALLDVVDGDEIRIIGDFTLDKPLTTDKNITITIVESQVRDKSGNISVETNQFNNKINLSFLVSVLLDKGDIVVPAGWTNTGGILTKEYAYETSLDDIIGEFGEAPNRTGYKFLSWSYANGGTLGSASSKITAVYDAEEYDIHLHHGIDGSDHGSAKVTYDGTLVDIISHAVRDGFKLLGYFTHESGGTMVLNADGTFAAHNIDDHITDGKWSKDAHHTLYAQWAPNEAPSENGYILEIVAGCVIEALIIIGVVAVIRRR